MKESDVADIWNRINGTSDLELGKPSFSLKEAITGNGEVAILNHLIGSVVVFVASFIAAHYGFKFSAAQQATTVAYATGVFNILAAFVTRQKVIPVEKVRGILKDVVAASKTVDAGAALVAPAEASGISTAEALAQLAPAPAEGAVEAPVTPVAAEALAAPASVATPVEDAEATAALPADVAATPVDATVPPVVG